LFIVAQKINAQKSESIPLEVFDSIKASFHQKPNLNFGIDSRSSFIGSTWSDILGAKFGVVFGKKFETGISGHLLNEEDSPVYKTYPVLTSANKIVDLQAQLQLFYMAPYAEYIFYNGKYWKLSVPVQLGFGESNFYYTYDFVQKVNNLHLVILCEPIFSAEYKFNAWFSLVGEVGLRFMLLNNPSVPQSMNSPTFSIGISLTYSQFIKRTFPDSKLAAWLNKI